MRVIYDKLYLIYSIIGIILFFSFIGGFLFEFYTNESFKDRLQMKKKTFDKADINESILFNLNNTTQDQEKMRKWDEDLLKLRKGADWLLWGSVLLWAFNIRHDIISYIRKTYKKRLVKQVR